MLALLLAACRVPGSAPRPTVVLGQPTSALTLDPHLHDEESTYSTLEHFYEKLVAFGPDMELLPELALTWQNPSETLWRIRLRRGVVFHDGRPFEAEDVAATIRRARALPGSRVAYYLEGVSDVRALDSETVEIETSRPSPILLNRLAFIGIVPRDTPLSPISRPVGTGPFRFLRGAPGQTIEAERFDRYWGAAPAWQEVRFVSLPDARSRAEAVSARVADAVSRFPYHLADWASRQPSTRLVSTRGLGVTLLGFRTKASPWADLRVRRAIALAIDRQALVPEGERQYSVPMDQLVPAGVFGHLPEPLADRPDLAEAARLLAEARFPFRRELRLTFADTHADIGQALCRQLGALGITVAPEPLPQPQLYARFSSADPPLLFLMSWAAGTGDGSDLLEALFHTPGEGLGTANRFDYSSPEVDGDISRAGQSLDPATRRDALWTAFRLLAADVPAVPLLLRSNLYAVRSDLEWTPRRNRRMRAVDLAPAPR